ncbi:hypothetical protein TNCV_4075361 [Trichonephila clavipes]|nr:hypothetical protein TNCV_4075361 [Trichonephila clavipes]
MKREETPCKNRSLSILSIKDSCCVDDLSQPKYEGSNADSTSELRYYNEVKEMSIEISGINSSNSFPGSKNEIHKKTCARPDRDANKKKSREGGPILLHKNISLESSSSDQDEVSENLSEISPWCKEKAEEIQRIILSNVPSLINESREKCDKLPDIEGKNTSLCGTKDVQIPLTCKETQSFVKSTVNDDSFWLNDNRREIWGSEKSSAAEDKFRLKDNQQHRLTKNKKKDKFIRQHPTFKKNKLQPKESVHNLRTASESNGNEQTNNKINQNCRYLFRNSRVSSIKNTHASFLSSKNKQTVGKKSLQKTNDRLKHLNPISSTFTEKETKNKKGIVGKEIVKKKYSVYSYKDKKSLKLGRSCNHPNGKHSQIPAAHFDNEKNEATIADNEKNEATGENDLDSSFSEESSKSSSKESFNLTSVSKDIQRSRSNQENSGRVFDKTKSPFYHLQQLSEFKMRFVKKKETRNLPGKYSKDGYAESKNDKLKNKKTFERQVTPISSSTDDTVDKRLLVSSSPNLNFTIIGNVQINVGCESSKHSERLEETEKRKSVDAGKLNSQNDEKISYSERGITGSNYLSTDDKDTVDKDETITFSGHRVSVIVHSSKSNKETVDNKTLLSSSSSNMNTFTNCERGATVIRCVSHCNKRIKLDRVETITSSVQEIIDISHSDSDEETKDIDET